MTHVDINSTRALCILVQNVVTQEISQALSELQAARAALVALLQERDYLRSVLAECQIMAGPREKVLQERSEKALKEWSAT